MDSFSLKSKNTIKLFKTLKKHYKSTHLVQEPTPFLVCALKRPINWNRLNKTTEMQLKSTMNANNPFDNMEDFSPP